ncbi:DUF2867 domain-containing protein [Flavilitoribacter nigricans]|uniref:DUF2867 domain-containing protein n=1 Tax=Flavilitoribacter nigricans (strain ATCC 23147 / DSM 23189 / NBRC 102662 / NCIMB 1420 / SS-2) TaxID=1122177 RepID=A0A2D0NAU7_FLAN2|nr:DUF2867 domain-containing protein [Flavilitoribacter nigricans]PHN05607.1 hypothetical protein CRP01_16605 [Flavilitoribacter nigricans DSM 23189 = NBRC 102662]
MKAYTQPIPEGSLIETALERIDYQDSFGIQTSAQVDVVQLPPLFFKLFPTWFMGLMYLREAIAGLIGLKTGRGIDVRAQLRDFTGTIGESIALFQVMGRSEEEILTGENDRHLDFRLSFFARPCEHGTELILSTSVQYNGWLGRAYFLPVKPVHRLIVPIILKRMARYLERNATMFPSGAQ